MLVSIFGIYFWHCTAESDIFCINLFMNFILDVDIFRLVDVCDVPRRIDKDFFSFSLFQTIHHKNTPLPELTPHLGEAKKTRF